MVNMIFGAARRRQKLDSWIFCSGEIFRRNFLPPRSEPFQPRKAHGKNRGLQFIEATVQSCFEMLVASFALAIISQRFYPACDFFGARDERASVALGAEILGRIETKSPPRAENSGSLPVPSRSMGVSTIFQQMNFCVFAERYPTLHFANVPI